MSSHTKVVCSTLKQVCHIERNLACLQELPRVGNNNIKNFRAAKKPSKQRRGTKTQGKGHKGQGQRGGTPRVGFEGGQTPFYLRVPKHGLANAKPKYDYTPLHLNRIQYFIDAGRIDPTKKLDMRTMLVSGLLNKSNIRDGVRLLDDGHTWFQGNINIEVSEATPQAIEAIERNGGSVTSIFHTMVSMRAHLKPEKYPHPPPLERPTRRQIEFYSDPCNRGFLANPLDIQMLRQRNRDLGPVAAQMKQLKLEDEVD